MRESVAFDHSEPRVATNFEGQFGGIADKGGDRVPFGEAGCKSGRAYSTCETMSAQGSRSGQSSLKAYLLHR